MKHFALFAVIAAVAAAFTAPAFGQGKAADGQAFYATQNCKMCHSVAAKGGKIALDNVGGKLKAEDIREWIVSPKTAAVKAKSTAKPPMISYDKLAKTDVDNLVAYLQTLKQQ